MVGVEGGRERVRRIRSKPGRERRFIIALFFVIR